MFEDGRYHVEAYKRVVLILAAYLWSGIIVIAKVQKIADPKLSIVPASTEATVSELINQVGQRVYRERKAKRLSRRILSELYGVSSRYLVQLENGEGNISIGLLRRVNIVDKA